MIIEPERPYPFETKVDSTDIDASHRDLARLGYRHYANVTNRYWTIREALKRAQDSGYASIVTDRRAYDDRGVVIVGSISIWVK